MNDITRITYSLEHLDGKTAMLLPRIQWNELIKHDGDITLLAEPPQPLHGVRKSAVVVAVVASGVVNADPGIDIVRRDEADKPYVYNLDHYRVIENLPLHPQFGSVLETAGLIDSDCLRQELADHVFIVGPYNKEHPDHWREELPNCILQAKCK